VYWLDQPDAPGPLPALAGNVTADLAIVGGGFTGLWTALLATERDPSLDVVLLETRTAGWGRRRLAAVPRRAALHQRHRDGRTGQAGLRAAPCLP
jgi:glycine/D-amino acid oxidase-like deaminating enzyme